MLILCLRTDKREAEVYIYENGKKLAEQKWEAHRKLADTIDVKIEVVLNSVGLDMAQIERIVIYEGPGSFTGLRIGFSVANAIGYSQNIPVVAASGEVWINAGLLV